MKSAEDDYLPTPAFTCMTAADKALVYEPAEDTMLFLDALAKDRDFLRNRKPSVVLEVGCGSGVVSVFAAKMLPTSCYNVCTDINIAAALVAQKVGNENKVTLDVVVTDLVSAFEGRLSGLVDLLLFNPPYVVTPSEEVGSGGIEAAWAGGHRGREVIDRMLPCVKELLSESGLFYMVALKENGIEEIEAFMKRLAFTMEVILVRRTGPEELHVLRFSRCTPT